METKRHFPGEYGYKDIIKFKRKGKIVEGMIVGITVSFDSENEYIMYKVHSLEGAEDGFYFYDVRYDKIIIMSDADVDGSHIKNLFYTFIWNFCPQLILDGYVYAGVPPLYKITLSGKYYYLKDDAALEEFRRNNAGKNYQVNRLKGLGEMNVEETEETITTIKVINSTENTLELDFNGEIRKFEKEK